MMAEAGQAGDGGDHQARKQLHGGHIAMVESMRSARETLEYPQRPAEMAQWRRQDRPRTQPPAAGQINAGVALGIVAKHNLAGAHTVSGNSRVGLQANSEIRRSASGSRAADDFVSLPQSNGGATRSCQSLGAFRNHTDR